MRCIQVCDKVQSLNIWDVAGTGGRTTVDVPNNPAMKNSGCSLCANALPIALWPACGRPLTRLRAFQCGALLSAVREMPGNLSSS